VVQRYYFAIESLDESGVSAVSGMVPLD